MADGHPEFRIFLRIFAELQAQMVANSDRYAMLFSKRLQMTPKRVIT
jgi:hypothetical protein